MKCSLVTAYCWPRNKTVSGILALFCCQAETVVLIFGNVSTTPAKKLELAIFLTYALTILNYHCHISLGYVAFVFRIERVTIIGHIFSKEYPACANQRSKSQQKPKKEPDSGPSYA